MAKTFPDKHLHSLQSLLDDESSSVREAVLAELIRLGPLAVEWLQALAAEESPELASHARHFLREMHCEDTVERFRDFIGAFNYELETGFLLLSSALDPKLEPSDCCLFLDRMAERVQQLTIEPASPVQMCRTLNRVMFHEYGFAGARNDFYHPDNSLLNRVLERRRGIPIALSVIYILVAQRCGFSLEPVGMPGRFIVGCFQEDLPFYIDVYDKGCFRSVEQLEELLMANHIRPQPVHLSPASTGDVLIRMCRNLVNQLNRSGQTRKAELFNQFIDAFEETYQRHS